MTRRQRIISVAVLIGAVFGISVFSQGYSSSLVRLLFDIALFAVAMAVIGRIRPAVTVRGELLRLALGVPVYLLGDLIRLTAAGALLEASTGGAVGGWMMITRVFTALGLAWSVWAVIRLGGLWWGRRRRRVVIAIVLTIALAWLDAPAAVVVLAGLYVVLAVVPVAWVDSLSGRWSWLVFLMALLAPVAAFLFFMDLNVDAEGMEALNVSLSSAASGLSSSTLFGILSRYMALFWLLLPVRLVVAIFQGTFGVRTPIWLKLALTYVFSTLIPALLFMALILVAIYLGIGTMRAYTVRNLIYEDLETLEKGLAQDRLGGFMGTDSVAAGIYQRVPPDPAVFGGHIMPTPDPSRARPIVVGGGRGAQPPAGEPSLPSQLAALPEEWEILAELDSLARTMEPQEVWVKVAARPSVWTLPDTLPLFPGWTDSTMSASGILPVGEGRSAFAAAVTEEPGDRLVTVAMRPLNVGTLNRYREVVGADITVRPYSAFTEGVSDGWVAGEGGELPEGYSRDDLNRRWRETKPVKTTPRKDGGIFHSSIYHGVCELHIWSGEGNEWERMLGQVTVSTSLAELMNSLYTTRGLNKVTLAVLGILAILFALAVLFSTLLGWGINRTITSSVAALRHGTEQLRRGNLNTTIAVKNRDELGDLARSFNQMTADLRRMIKEVAEKERLEREVQIARHIQERLLPEVLPARSRVGIAGRSEPAFEVGGDYFDAIDQDDTGILFALGDVSGKGIGAAILMSNLQANLQMLGRQRLPLDEMMTQLNRQIYHNSTPEMFITFFLGRVDPEGRTLQYINAGHDVPVMLRGSKVLDLHQGGMLMGAVPEVPYEAGEVELREGDMIVLYSDGITEAMDEEDEEFGRDRLVKVLRELRDEAPADIVAGVLRAVRDYAGLTRAGRDDLTLLVMKIGEGCGDESRVSKAASYGHESMTEV